jgi:hypothetical protein
MCIKTPCKNARFTKCAFKGKIENLEGLKKYGRWKEKNTKTSM